MTELFGYRYCRRIQPNPAAFLIISESFESPRDSFDDARPAFYSLKCCWRDRAPSPAGAEPRAFFRWTTVGAPPVASYSREMEVPLNPISRWEPGLRDAIIESMEWCL